MSRALRKVQRQQLDLQAQSNETQAADSEEDEEDDEVASKAAPNPFDLLNAGTERPAEEPESDDNHSEVSGDEGAELQQAIANSLQNTSQSQPKNQKKKKKNKKKLKAQKSKAVDNIEDKVNTDDAAFEAALSAHRREVANTIIPEAEEKPFNLTELLSVDVKMLDPNVEMRRLFGSKVISSERAERTSTSRRNMPRGMQQQLNRGRKSVLVPMEDNYPLTIKGGLEMEMEEDIDGIKTFRFVHSKMYQQTQYTFMQCVQSGDPQTLMNLLTRAPFHVDTLLQVSEILRHQGDNEQSGEMLTRALFAFDRAFHPLFNVASGLVRLPFEIPENRPFYLAIYRYIQSLGRRGCWATAFEFNKLLYALAPEEDPYAALLSIDFYAIKARNWTYVRKLVECPWDRVLDHDFYKPNLAYAKALAAFLSDTKHAELEENKAELGSAIKQFPYLVGPLFSELKATGPIQYDTIEPSNQFGRLVRDLYVYRAKDIYNTPEITKFLRDAAIPVESFTPTELPDDIPTNVCRHILLLDERTLLHYLPKEITASPGLSFDPLPPDDSLPSYLDAYMPTSGVLDGGRTMVPQFIQDLLRRILPNHEPNTELNDEQVAQLMQQIELEGGVEGGDVWDGAAGDGGQAGRPGAGGFDDPNGYGPNRGVDEPDREGNAGRR
ncbi:protein of unknown function [Taphrina deformans PYCC 5710]|uniref:Transcription factor 25 n=1 Tax=Taphrina deformans (strain PYCC 5710 / ATCC 11124 / CBS 356.35 / IMI 108563 / JCM 9778 / NBRC 8474) TaxID=1097556 RepID=R4XDS4_TAPDE|nr:protein of unknown function [Taphrina deformans PYCC 5710]|eukprot:CCG84021.1 protein of unknown function [Taphrina deformans PYCC 5710]